MSQQNIIVIGNGIVITSYSIHYTKLYENQDGPNQIALIMGLNGVQDHIVDRTLHVGMNIFQILVEYAPG